MINLYKTIYEDKEVEYSLEKEEERKKEEKRLKNLNVKFTTKKVNYLKKNIN